MDSNNNPYDLDDLDLAVKLFQAQQLLEDF